MSSSKTFSTLPLVEAVPNFSTSDPEVINLLKDCIDSYEDTYLLHVDPDTDYNRTVITFVSTQERIVEISVKTISLALELIDMRTHKGEHPRIGAVDVFPLVPLGISTFKELIPLAREIGEKVGSIHKIPVYCYGKAALRQERQTLFAIRKGQYEGLKKKLKENKWQPDFGLASFNPKTGAVVIGVRDFLIAYNVNLDTKDVKLATGIARKIRTSGHINSGGTRVPGKLEKIQAMGVVLNRQRGTFTQVSTNILDFKHSSSLHHVFESCKDEANKLDIKVTGSEIVGLVPREALSKAYEFYTEEEKGLGIELDISYVIQKLGLNDLYEFQPEKKILDHLLEGIYSN